MRGDGLAEGREELDLLLSTGQGGQARLRVVVEGLRGHGRGGPRPRGVAGPRRPPAGRGAHRRGRRAFLLRGLCRLRTVRALARGALSAAARWRASRALAVARSWRATGSGRPRLRGSPLSRLRDPPGACSRFVGTRRPSGRGAGLPGRSAEVALRRQLPSSVAVVVVAAGFGPDRPRRARRWVRPRDRAGHCVDWRRPRGRAPARRGRLWLVLWRVQPASRPRLVRRGRDRRPAALAPGCAVRRFRSH